MLSLLKLVATGRNWSAIILSLMIIGFVGITVVDFSNIKTTSNATAVFIALASMVVGGILGFLFGIPKSLQGNDPVNAGSNNHQAIKTVNGYEQRYIANTNLEQISDWLTKILVGVGLTQLSDAPRVVRDFGEYFGQSYQNAGMASRFIIAASIFFLMLGFLFSYLWTRLFLGGELARADVAAQVKNVIEARDMQDQVDAKALSLSTRLLLEGQGDSIDREELKDSIDKSSPQIKVQIFYRARDYRARNTERAEDKVNVARVIPIFKALIASDKDERFHQNYAQLAYALKDQRNPDFAGAENALSKAIDIRGSARDHRYEIYEFVRAICRIQQDKNFILKQKSTDADFNNILSDLKVAVRLFQDLNNDRDVVDWLNINEVKNVQGQSFK